ncbi:MAG: ribonuclease Y [Gemmiger sp.]|nr:ribonuclease Y [Gemmiger sp.]
MVPIIVMVVVVIVAAAISGAACFVGGSLYRKKTAEAKLGSAEEEAKRLVNEAIKTADQKRKETIIEAKDEAFKLKAEADREIKDRRAEVTRQERRIDQKEESLDKRNTTMERKEEDLKKRAELVEARLDELEQLKLRQTDKLETIAAMTREDARAVLLKQLDDELTHEKAMRISAYETNLKDQCDTMARELVGQAIARCAADSTSEATVSVVPLPSDEMKGRIIGREGRNIRALETATGCDLIIDDTPEAITLSSFDQTRREVARMALERLIADGRIHPARIEETVEKCRRELEITMKREGDHAAMDLGIHGLHPDLVKLVGRLRFRTSYGQNVLNHSLEVAWLAGLMAGELGINVAMARRAGLLHDIGKALDHEIEGSHVQIGVDICKKYKENPAIIHAIEAHHADVEPKTPLAFIIMAADAISAARPGARRENMESYIKRLETLEALCNGFEGVESSFAVQAGREVRILVQPDKIGDDQVILLARSIAKKIEDELDYPGQIKVNVIRESRATEYAK